MTGFFTKDQTASIVRPDGRHLSCNSCGLYRDAKSPKMIPYGQFEKGIMCIGDMPGEVEDMRGKPWQGKDGILLRQTFADLGIDLFKDCINLNAINCRPMDKTGKTRKPMPFEVDCCRRIVLAAIKQYKPKVIILLGMVAITSVIGNRWKKDLGSIAKWTGFTIPDQDLQCWICPVFNPLYVLREDKQEITTHWKQDLQRAFDVLDKPFPVYKKPNITFLKEDQLSTLNKIKSGVTAIDFETTGLKPHAKGHKIVCVSIATSENEVCAFMMPAKRSSQQPFIWLLENKDVKKVGHNIKYEHTWALNCLRGTVVAGWIHDCMLKAHIIDNRTGVTGLKFQVYVQFGVISYDESVYPFLQSKDSKNGNSMNSILELIKTSEGKQSLMYYCALDSIFTFRLMLLQQNKLT